MSPELPGSGLSKETETSTPEAKKDILPKQETNKPITFHKDLKQEKLKQDAKALSQVVLGISENLKPKPKN